MNKAPIWIFFDNIILEYSNHYGKASEKILIKEFQEYLFDLSKTSKIIILTQQNTLDIAKWFANNNLSQFIYAIKNPIF